MEKKTVTGMLLALLIFSILTANMIMVAAQEKHDVAVVSVTPSATLVEKGNVLNISVIVENQGDFTETFNLDCTYNENLIDTETNITLNSGVSKNVTFNWNTTKFWDYTSPQKIAATASIVSGETDIEDNTLVSSNRVRVFASPYVGVIPHTTVNSSLTIGTNYTVSIYTDYNGSDITGYQFSLTYNPNVLAGVSVVNDGILSDALFEPGTFNNVAGELWIPSAFYFGAGVVTSGPGKLATITFTVVGLGDSYITLGDATILFGWNSTVSRTYHIVSDWEPYIFHLLHGFFQNAEVTHDVAVVSVVPYPTVVVEGEIVTITVVIENQGTVAEDVTVKVYYDYDPISVPIEKRTVSGLAVGTSRSINFTWNTEYMYAKTYNITGLADELLGETDTDDNTLQSDETVTVLLDAVYIRPNGSIDPPIAPISTVDNVAYTLTGNISASIVVERDSIVVDGAGYSVQGGGGTGIYLYGRNNVTIKNMEIKGEPTYGIWLFKSSNNTISGNNITVASWTQLGIAVVDRVFKWNGNRIVGNNITGGLQSIYVVGSSGNTISENNIKNLHLGVLIGGSSKNSITENNITGNSNASLYGFDLSYSSNNTISGNIVENTRLGIFLSKSSNNSIYHNNFINNTQQVYDESWDDPFHSVPPSINIWDDGDEGNFWSDFEEKNPDAEELDDSGIWDTPYFIDENNQDNYPLVEPWSPKPPSPVEATQELIETIEDWNLPKGLEKCLTSKLDNIIHQLNKGNENVAINKLIVFINQVEALRNKKLTIEQVDQLTSEEQRIIDLINE